MSLPTMAFLIGTIFLAVAIVGGGFEVKEIKIPKVSAGERFIAGLFGAFFIGLSLWLGGLGLGDEPPPPPWRPDGPVATKAIDLSSLVNRNLNTYANGQYYQQGGTVSINGTNFQLTTFPGTSGTGVIQTDGTETYTIPINLNGAQSVSTLINSAFGVIREDIGSLTFHFTGGHYVYTLTEGYNVRDHNNDDFVNTASNIDGSAYYGNGRVRLDMQKILFPLNLSSGTLLSVDFTGRTRFGYPGGQPFLAAMNVTLAPRAPGQNRVMRQEPQGWRSEWQVYGAVEEAMEEGEH